VFNNIKSVYWVGLGEGVGILPIRQHPFNNFNKCNHLHSMILLHPVNVQNTEVQIVSANINNR